MKVKILKSPVYYPKKGGEWGVRKTMYLVYKDKEIEEKEIF